MKMQNRFFLILVLSCAILGIGMEAMAQGAKPSGPVPATLAESHVQKGIGCPQCHGTGKTQAVTMDKCQTCHGDGKAVAQRTAKVKPTNPHDSRHFGTEADCNSCHHQHRPSESLCADCHSGFKFKVP
jgi:RecJ-like exonuclease